MKIKNLDFQYTKSGRKIFDQLNWELDLKRVHFILGGNGVGKTTFYEIITGLLDYDGVIENPIDPKDILLQLQGVPMLATMKGKDLADLLVGSDNGFGEITLERIQANLPLDSHEKLAYLWDSTYGNMSVGERRWLSIYLFSLLDREFYIFDEPTAGLDVQSAKEILQIIENLSTERNKKVLLTTHQLAEIDYFSDYTITFFHKGKNYFTGSKSEFKAIQSATSSEYEALTDFLK